MTEIKYAPLATWEFIISGALYGYSRQIIRTNPSSSVGGRS